jgi:1,4-alpha-glucan branching enzyme
VETIAEESTAFPKVSHAVQEGGLGFNQKWMMGWMHDTLSYFKRPTVFRKWHQNEITFSLLYAFSEKFMLPLSHDEVVHLKGSLLQKMPGDTWQRFANLRALFGIQWTHPGHQLLFMGGEIGQPGEWSHDAGVQWNLLQYPRHRGIKNWVTALNHFYTSNPALWIHASDPNGFKWVSGDDVQNSVIAFLRIENPANQLLVVCHLAPGTIENYQLGVPIPGTWTEVLNSDKVDFGGTGNLNPPLPSTDMPSHGFNHSISFKLAPLAVQIFQCPVAPLETSL